MLHENRDISELLEEAIEKYSDMVKRIGFLYVKNSFEADDVMQNVFIKYMLYINKKSFKNENHEKSWLVLVTANVCKDYLKSYWKHNVTLMGERDFPSSENEEENIIEYVKKLPEKYKLYIYLFYYENYSVDEISKLTGANCNTIYSGLHRARKLLKDYMEGDKDKYE